MTLAPAFPLLASARRARTVLESLGDPLPLQASRALDSLRTDAGTDERVARAVEDILAPLVAFHAEVDVHGVISTTQGAASLTLQQHGWRSFLVRVFNPHQVEASLNEVTQGTFGTQGVFGLLDHASNAARVAMPDTLTSVPRIANGWLSARLAPPAHLSGLVVEFKVVSLYSRDSGNLTGIVGFGSEVFVDRLSDPRGSGSGSGRMMTEGRDRGATITVESLPAHPIQIDVREPNGDSCMASITVRDHLGRSYPAKAMRLAPDMFFQDHVYRATGETIQLPEGAFEVSATRGSEYRPVRSTVDVDQKTEKISITLDRWADPASHGYYSGDPHIHAGGCSHYSTPTEGVTPATMIRHVRGEGLWLGGVLNWAPSYYYQRQFFSGRSISPAAILEHPEMQAAQGMTWTPIPTQTDDDSHLRYDVEISGFPSSHSGHAILLGLSEQDYPGTSQLEDWPSWNLPVMQWARSQGALAGYAHCGFGLSVGTLELPNYVVPQFQSIGSNEIIVDVPLGSADFQCGAQLDPAVELNIWYHLLNVGYRTLMLGETDYPCVYDDRPGVGRTYVRLSEPPRGEGALETWTTGLVSSPSYFGDGRSHVFDLALDGEIGRETTLLTAGKVRVSAIVAAWLPAERPVRSDKRVLSGPVGWDLEEDRIDGSRTVLLEAIVNGRPLAAQPIEADGIERAVSFTLDLQQSSWVALRILHSVHTQPMFVEIGSEPIRASRRSAVWLHDSVDALWAAKSGFIRTEERSTAHDAYQAAKTAYLERYEQCEEGS